MDDLRQYGSKKIWKAYKKVVDKKIWSWSLPLKKIN